MDSSIRNKFECPICEDIYQKPIYQCPTGHSFCGSCKIKLLTCPLCQKPFQDTRNYALEEIMTALLVKCENELCPETITLASYAQHAVECEYRETQCKFPGCAWAGSEVLTNDHILKAHKALVVEKCTSLQGHQVGKCFMMHQSKMFLITRYKKGKLYTWNAEPMERTPIKKLLLVIKITLAEGESYTLSQPIKEFRKEGLHEPDENVVWILASKLNGCKTQMTIEDLR